MPTPISETILEQQFIGQLEDLKYAYRDDIRDRASLHANFREKFESLNRCKLTNKEFDRLLQQIVRPDVFLASRSLRERDTFEREDGTPLHFELVNTRDWCKNTFEVINQLRMNTANSFHRYDVVLLLNGIPVVQVDLEGDLTSLLEQVGGAAKSAGTAVVLFIDELQYLKEDQFAALISALHRSAQGRLPVTVVGAGLPQLLALAGNAKSYAERLFDFPQIGALDPEEAKLAIVKPARDKGADYIPEATDEIVEQTRGYPYFLQEWGKHSWDIAKTSPITLADVKSASIEAIAALDESFFRVRFDRLTPKEKQYLRAMAELGMGPHRSGDIATLLNKPTNSLGPLRASLIIKGMIWSPNHGDTAFTVPLFDEFMKRIMPGTDW